MSESMEKIKNNAQESVAKRWQDTIGALFKYMSGVLTAMSAVSGALMYLEKFDSYLLWALMGLFILILILLALILQIERLSKARIDCDKFLKVVQHFELMLNDERASRETVIEERNKLKIENEIIRSMYSLSAHGATVNIASQKESK